MIRYIHLVNEHAATFKIKHDQSKVDLQNALKLGHTILLYFSEVLINKVMRSAKVLIDEIVNGK